VDAGIVSIRFKPRAAGRQGAIIVGVAALHAAAILALLLDRIAPERPAERGTEITFIQLPPVARRAVKPRHRPRSQRPAVVWPDYHWVVPLPGINVGPGAISIPPIGKLRFPPPTAELLRGSCPKVLRPDSPVWKRCMPAAPPKEDDGWQEFEVPPTESLYADRWRKETQVRDRPIESPCSYVRTDPATGIRSNMADLGCAAKSLFGGD
jgi:hypothetical protein